MAMADGYGLFWNSNSGDRKYDAQSFEKWLKKFFTSGVFEGDLQVLASSGMTVQVQTGYSNVNGKVGLFESATNVTLSAANSRYPRIDTIIIERNDVDRVIQIDKVTGAYTGENPQPTAPIWDETQGIYQLVLAQIYVGAGVSSISQEDITDKRTDTDVCGYIAGTVNEMDFSQFTAQFEAYFSTFEATQLAEFETWFDHMKDQLDSDAAGHLQAEVDEVNSAMNAKQDTNPTEVITDPSSSGIQLVGDKYIDYDKLADALLSKYSLTQLAGKNQTVQNALTGLKQQTDNVITPVDGVSAYSFNNGDFFMFGGVLYRASQTFSNVTLTNDNIATYGTAQTQTALNALNDNLNNITDIEMAYNTTNASDTLSFVGKARCGVAFINDNIILKNNGIVGTLSVKPKYGVRATVYDSQNRTPIGQAMIEPDGTIKVFSPSTGIYVQYAFLYMY